MQRRKAFTFQFKSKRYFFKNSSFQLKYVLCLLYYLLIHLKTHYLFVLQHIFTNYYFAFASMCLLFHILVLNTNAYKYMCVHMYVSKYFALFVCADAIHTSICIWALWFQRSPEFGILELRKSQDDFISNMGQQSSTKTKNNMGNTARDTLSISRHIIFSTPVSVSVQATDRRLCRRAGFGGPPLPCSEVCPGVVGVCVDFRERTAPPSQLATVAH